MAQSHTRKKLCKFWQSGHCRFGDGCKFAHGNNDHRPPPTIDPFQEWRLKFPRNNIAPRPTDLTKLFQDGLAFISGGNCALMQETVILLASDPGLIRIRELIQCTLTPTNGDVFMTEQLMPFFNSITHPNVDASPLLENHVVTIYNFIYGPGGQRATTLFNFLATLLKQIDFSQKMRQAQFEIIFEIFVQVMLRNGAAHVNEQLIPIAGTFLDKALELSHDLQSRESWKLRKLADKLNRHLKMGREIPSTSSKPADPHATKAEYVQEQRPPGGRHDNDHANICDIQIMPTYDEVQSQHSEYLPVRGQRSENLSGLDGLIDRHFRLLREDTVGQFRDAIRMSIDKPSTTESRNVTNVARTYTYTNFRIIDIFFLKGSGIEFFVQVDQPAQYRDGARRKEWWARSKRLQQDALVCITNLGTSHIYCTVSAQGRPMQRQNGEREPSEHHLQTTRLQKYNDQNLFSQRDRAYFSLKPIHRSRNALAPLLLQADTLKDTNLVEFPGVLLPAFQPTLLALQSMLKTRDMPFVELLTARNGDTVTLDIPAYAQSPDFRYDLDCLTKSGLPLPFYPQRHFDVDSLVRESTLDEPQAKALLHCLTTSLSLIQGPPGTGKSFTGIALIKTLLTVKPKARLGPIVCVCYTNHALDQLLEHLHESGVKQIVRVGSRSKSEILEGVNLRIIARNIEQTRAEKRAKWELHQRYDADTNQASILLDKLHKAHFVRHVREYLQNHNSRHHSQLFGTDEADGWQTVTSKDSEPLRKWAQRGLSTDDGATPRFLDELQQVHLDETTSIERHILLDSWISGVREGTVDDVLTVAQSYDEIDRQYDAIRGSIDLRCLEGADVVGLTTTGLARNLDVLRKLRAKVLVCEEAGEVLEAHVLTALLPKLEHIILIGDHQQLRPQVQNYELSRENPRGHKYSLDVSLFERLVHDPHGLQCSIPYRTLEIQRRMHPLISQLIRNTLYPELKDAHNVSTYHEVAGMKQRLFWFDHNQQEDYGSEDNSVTTSHSNAFEVSMVTALVAHLVRQGVYQSGEIAVLTPYLSQLFKLRAALSQIMEVSIGERDLEQAERQGVSPEDENEQQKVKPVNAAKTSLLQAMRVATIDNFQGEEAKVVIISLVRSNEQSRVGFLRTSNRINVLLSRAQHGMYIIGNSRTASAVPMWQQVFGLLRENNCIGSTLDLQCERHPETPIPVTTPEEFVVMSPEGGCGLLCDRRLLCGHPCRNKCHSALLHDAVHCLEPCPRSLKGCDHPCPRNCGDPCVKDCGATLTGQIVVLSCGHEITSPSCWQNQSPERVACIKLVNRTVPDCGHDVEVKCCTDVAAPNYQCSSICETILPCGHECRKKCFLCRPKQGGKVQQAASHGQCGQICGRLYNICSHSCQSRCHEGPCPPCEKRCDVACIHSKCDKKCCEPCTPCAHDVCQSQCPHSKCTMPCAAPCNWIPCGERCAKDLDCGHQCPSLCGEVCPSSTFCQTCATDEVKNQAVDMILMETYAEIDLDKEPCIVPPCGHILTASSMDGMTEMTDFYQMDQNGKVIGLKEKDLDITQKIPVCPQCRGSLRNVNRYGRMVRQILLLEATKKFVSWSNAEFIPLAQNTHVLQDRLSASTSEAARHFGTLPALKVELGRDILQQVRMIKKLAGNNRYKDLISACSKITKHANIVGVEEQPFRKVWDLVQNKRRRHGIDSDTSFELDNSILQTRQHMLAVSLLLRTHLAILCDFLGHAKITQDSRIDLVNCRAKCEELANSAIQSSQPAIQVEAYVYYGRYCAAEQIVLSNAIVYDSSEEDIEAKQLQLEQLKQEGLTKIAQAKIVCEANQGSTKHLKTEVEQVEMMIKQSVVSDIILPHEMKAIYDAMSQEFRGTGHWYRCENNHLFTVGECGMPMQLARCPQCDAPVGGRSHQAAAGVTAARDLERQMESMRLI